MKMRTMPPIEEANAINTQRVAALRAELAELPLNDSKLTLEIGCGHGHFLAAYAPAHPEEFCIAIDIIKGRLEKAARKTTRAGTTNVSWLRASSDHFLEAWPEGPKFSGRVLVLFPDPWPKRKHWKNRLIQPTFLHELAQIVTPGTPLCFRTDHEGYFAHAHAVVAQHPDWTLLPNEPWPFEERTIFEAKADSHQSWIAERRSN